MSLVHEALQKAEREKRRKTGAPPPTVRPFPAASATVSEWGRAATISSPAPRNDPISPDPASARNAEKSSHTVLTMLLICVALVTIAGIVVLITHASSTIRESKNVVGRVAAVAVPSTETGAADAQPITLSSGDAHPPAASPEAVPRPSSSEFKLSGIMNNPDGTFCAVLNGYVVYAREKIPGGIVKSITKTEVVIETPAGLVELTLN